MGNACVARRKFEPPRRSPLVLRQRIYVDTLTHSNSALRFLIGELGPERVLLGSDYPADMADNGQGAAIESLGLADDAVQKILGGTAASLLGLAW